MLIDVLMKCYHHYKSPPLSRYFKLLMPLMLFKLPHKIHIYSRNTSNVLIQFSIPLMPLLSLLSHHGAIFEFLSFEFKVKFNWLKSQNPLLTINLEREIDQPFIRLHPINKIIWLLRFRNFFLNRNYTLKLVMVGTHPSWNYKQKILGRLGVNFSINKIFGESKRLKQYNTLS